MSSPQTVYFNKPQMAQCNYDNEPFHVSARHLRRTPGNQTENGFACVWWWHRSWMKLFWSYNKQQVKRSIPGRERKLLKHKQDVNLNPRDPASDKRFKMVLQNRVMMTLHGEDSLECRCVIKDWSVGVASGQDFHHRSSYVKMTKIGNRTPPSCPWTNPSCNWYSFRSDLFTSSVLGRNVEK